MEHYGAVLQRISAVHAAGAPRAAMKLFSDEHSNLYEVVKWACSGPPPESEPVFSDLLWNCMDVLTLRLDEGERKAFCQASARWIKSQSHEKKYERLKGCCAFSFECKFTGLGVF